MYLVVALKKRSPPTLSLTKRYLVKRIDHCRWSMLRMLSVHFGR